VTVGRIGRAHGVRGELFLERYGDSPGILDPGRSLDARSVEKGGGSRRVTVVAGRPLPNGKWLMRFEGVDDRDAARELTGLVLEVDESELAPLEEGGYYRFQLIGLKAVTPEGESLGVVEEV